MGCSDRHCTDPVGLLSFNWIYLTNELIVRILLTALCVLASKMPTFRREVYGVDWYDHFYPYIESEKFSERNACLILGLINVLLPLVILIIFAIWFKIPRRLLIEELISFFLGVSFAIQLVFAVNELIKNSYGRMRPDYLSRCFGNDKNLWPQQDVAKIPPIPECTSDFSAKALSDGRKSFPSGHTSLSFTVCGYIALFTYRKLSQVKNTGSWRLVVPLSITSLALFIGISRTQDYRHFPTDVIGGAILGSTLTFMTWSFYDQIMARVYSRCRKIYGSRDPFNLSTPPMYTALSPVISEMQSIEEV